MRITTWNVNSIRRRIDLVLGFVSTEQPDVLCLQETKCSDGQFPRKDFEAAGYEVATYGAGGYGGVALLSRVGLDRISYGFGGNHGPPFDQPRLLSADVGGLRLITLYAPNGQRMRTPAWDFKLAWFELLRIELELELEETDRLLVAGDFNVCPKPEDVYDPVKKKNRNLVSDPERAAVARLFDLGLTDLGRTLHPDEPGYTWYAYSAGQFAAGRGYRLDLALASAPIAASAVECRPQRRWREPQLQPSDHTPVTIEIDDGSANR